MLHTLASCVAVTVSLLCFPTYFVWMLGGWLLWHTILVGRGRPGWVPVAAALTLLILKTPPLTTVLVGFAVVLCFVAVLRYRACNQPKQEPKQRIAMAGSLWIAWGVSLVHWHMIERRSEPLTLDAERPVVCIGDSLTDGLLPDKGYPDALQDFLAIPVVNLGFSGIATSQGRDQMSRVLSHRPQIVIIELGGHDFLKGRSRAATKANLVEMIRQCRENDAEPVLMEIPRGFLIDPFFSLERDIAHEMDVELIHDGWLREIVLLSPIAPPGMWLSESDRLSDDGIHSNRQGSRRIAQRVATTLRRLVGNDAILDASVITD